MKKFVDLQFFAEESQTEEVKPAEATEEKKSTKPEAKYTDEDLDRIISQKMAKLRAQAEREQAQKQEAERLAKMTEEEKQKAELENLKSELNELKYEKSLTAMKGTARELLAGENIHVSDALLSNLVTADNADKTKESVSNFIAMYKQAVADGVKEALKGKTPLNTGTKGNGLTKEDILAVKDRAKRQKLIAENRSLFIGAK